ncbi:MAG: DNA topoisomerase VI subunit B [Candidatus Hodarchaeota archaeon]
MPSKSKKADKTETEKKKKSPPKKRKSPKSAGEKKDKSKSSPHKDLKKPLKKKKRIKSSSKSKSKSRIKVKDKVSTGRERGGSAQKIAPSSSIPVKKPEQAVTKKRREKKPRKVSRGVIKLGTIAKFMRRRTQLVGFEKGIAKNLQYTCEFIDNGLDAIETLQWKKKIYKLDGTLKFPKNDMLKRFFSAIRKKSSKSVDEAGEEIDENIMERMIGLLTPFKEIIANKEPLIILSLRETRTVSSQLEKKEKEKDKEEKENSKQQTTTKQAEADYERLYELMVFDNGVGMVKSDVEKYGLYLASSKSEQLKQTRGSQGFGSPSAFSDAQNTSGKPINLVSKKFGEKTATMVSFFTTGQNTKEYVLSPEILEFDFFDYGTFLILYYLNVKYKRGYADTYVEQTALLNPHVNIVFIDPYDDVYVYPRLVKTFPSEPAYAKLHPASISIGEFRELLRTSKKHSLKLFLTKSFVRITNEKAKQIIQRTNEISMNQGLPTIGLETQPSKLSTEQAELLYNVFHGMKYLSPPTNTVSPVGEKQLENVAMKVFKPEFAVSVTRKPTSGKGLAFVVEACIAYGGEISDATSASVVLWRCVNRVPKLRDNSDCAIWKACTEINWKQYQVDQFENGMPKGKVRVIVHVCGPFVHLMFKGQSKQALAEDDHLIKEIKLALQEVGRKARLLISRRERERRFRERAGKLAEHVRQFSEDLVAILKTDSSPKYKKVTVKTVESKMLKAIKGLTKPPEELQTQTQTQTQKEKQKEEEKPPEKLEKTTSKIREGVAT